QPRRCRVDRRSLRTFRRPYPMAEAARVGKSFAAAGRPVFPFGQRKNERSTRFTIPGHQTKAGPVVVQNTAAYNQRAIASNETTSNPKARRGSMSLRVSGN